MKRLILLVGAILISTYSLLSFEFPNINNHQHFLQSITDAWKTNQHLQQDKNDILVGYAGADILSAKPSIISTKTVV